MTQKPKLGETGSSGPQCLGAVGVRGPDGDGDWTGGPDGPEGPHDTPELLDSLVKAHHQIDMLMAMVITLDKTFMPSKSPLWPDIVARVELIKKHGGTL